MFIYPTAKRQRDTTQPSTDHTHRRISQRHHLWSSLVVAMMSQSSAHSTHRAPDHPVSPSNAPCNSSSLSPCRGFSRPPSCDSTLNNSWPPIVEQTERVCVCVAVGGCCVIAGLSHHPPSPPWWWCRPYPSCVPEAFLNYPPPTPTTSPPRPPTPRPPIRSLRRFQMRLNASAGSLAPAQRNAEQRSARPRQALLAGRKDGIDFLLLSYLHGSSLRKHKLWDAVPLCQDGLIRFPSVDCWRRWCGGGAGGGSGREEVINYHFSFFVCYPPPPPTLSLFLSSQGCGVIRARETRLAKNLLLAFIIIGSKLEMISNSQWITLVVQPLERQDNRRQKKTTEKTKCTNKCVQFSVVPR